MNDNILSQNLFENLTYLIKEKIKRDGKGKVNSSGKGVVLCLYHDESNPSLHFNLYKGLIKCFGCGKRVSLSDFLRDLKEHLGFDWSSNDTDYKKLKETECSLSRVVDEATFIYTDETGKPLCYKWRRDYEDGTKDFNLFNPDGEEVNHFFGLYALPLVAKANEVFFVEGEKVADALIQLGLPATTLCRGATGKLNKLEKQALLKLKGKTIFLCPDADKIGFQYMAMIERFLNKKGIETQFINPPESLTDGEDLFDYINQLKEQGLNDKEIKKNILNLTKEDAGTPFDEIQARTTEWTIPDWVPKGKLTIIAGKAGVGKTRIALVLACSKANGTPIFTAQGFKEVKQGLVAYFSLEDDPSNLASWCDVVGIKRSSNLKMFELESFKNIRKTISKYKPELVVIDPASYLISDEKSLEGVKPVLEPLVRLAKENNIAIVTIWHYNKQITTNIMQAISGHSRITAMAKRIIGLEKKENKIVVYFEKTANTEPVAFVADESKFEWQECNGEEFGVHIPKGEEIANVIKQELEKAPNKTLPFNEIAKLIEPFGVSKGYLSLIKDRHLKDVISKPVRKNGRFIGWSWELPDYQIKSDNLVESVDNTGFPPDYQITYNIPQQELTGKNPLKINELETQEKNDTKKIKNDNLVESVDNTGFEPDYQIKSDNLVNIAKKNQKTLNNKDFFNLKISVVPRELLKKYKLENPELYDDPDFRQFATEHIINSSKQKKSKSEELPTVIIDGEEYIDADKLFEMEGLIC